MGHVQLQTPAPPSRGTSLKADEAEVLWIIHWNNKVSSVTGSRLKPQTTETTFHISTFLSHVSLKRSRSGTTCRRRRKWIPGDVVCLITNQRLLGPERHTVVDVQNSVEQSDQQRRIFLDEAIREELGRDNAPLCPA